MSPVIIRLESPDDIPAIRAVHTAAFGQPDEAQLVDRLRDHGPDNLAWVAASDGQVVGHIQFSSARLEFKSGHVEGMALGPMAVLPEYQGRGIGTRLVQTGMAHIESTRCPFVVVLGHPEFYPRLEFEPASRFAVRCRWDVPDDVFMLRVLDASRMPRNGGVVAYHPEFNVA